MTGQLVMFAKFFGVSRICFLFIVHVRFPLKEGTDTLRGQHFSSLDRHGRLEGFLSHGTTFFLLSQESIVITLDVDV